MSRWLYPGLLVVAVVLSSLATVTVTAQQRPGLPPQPARSPRVEQDHFGQQDRFGEQDFLPGQDFRGGMPEAAPGHKEFVVDEQSGRPLGYLVVVQNVPQAFVLVDDGGRPFAAVPAR